MFSGGRAELRSTRDFSGRPESCRDFLLLMVFHTLAAYAHDRMFSRMRTQLIDGLGHATRSAIVPVSRSRTLSF